MSLVQMQVSREFLCRFTRVHINFQKRIAHRDGIYMPLQQLFFECYPSKRFVVECLQKNEVRNKSEDIVWLR